MYAVVRSGNKQYPVKAGSVLKVDRLDKEVNASFEIDDVLFAMTDDGRIASGASVTAVVLSHEKDDKVLIFKKRRRKNYRRKRGFRHSITLLRVQSVVCS